MNETLPQNIAGLSRFIRPRTAMEICDLCGSVLFAEHSHLLERSSREIKCACTACSILFSNASNARFARIPTDVRRLDDLVISDEEWQSLTLPIDLAFFTFISAEGRVAAFYPSPAGAMRSELPLEEWSEIAADHHAIGEMKPDVEALLVNRARGNREYFIAPIDECYKLVGLLRSKWRGLSGGVEVWASVDEFFTLLRARQPVKEIVDA